MNMLAQLKMNPPLEGGTIEVPKPGTLTPLSGSGAFVATIDMLREFDTNGVEPGQLSAIIDALEEQEHLYAMAVLSSEKTGIDNTVWILPVPGGRHGPRLKIAIDPPHAKRPGGKEATVPFDRETVPPITAALEQQVREFIALNRSALLEYWNGNTTTDEFLAQLKSIK